ncbi:MAG: hypothetical protein IPM54_22105 [Polyangiaceae bacterium]|nr:hypothetical protein [Polyangiaceae bacterium]
MDEKKAILLRDLGRSPDEQPVLSLPSPLLPWGGVFAVIVLGVFVRYLRANPGQIVVAAAIALAVVVALLLPRKLLLGNDGLLLVWWRARFIRFRDIDYIETTDGFYFHHPGINIVFKNGKALAFATSVFKERWAERDALISLIRVYVEAAANKLPPQTNQALFRAGRDHTAWARALVAMGHGAHFDPRMPAVLPDDLLRVAESTDAPTVDRTAAFVALAAAKDSATVKRLRAALEHTVAPAARSALRGALDAGSDEARIASVLEYAEKVTQRE